MKKENLKIIAHGFAVGTFVGMIPLIFDFSTLRLICVLVPAVVSASAYLISKKMK